MRWAGLGGSIIDDDDDDDEAPPAGRATRTGAGAVAEGGGEMVYQMPVAGETDRVSDALRLGGGGSGGLGRQQEASGLAWRSSTARAH